MDLSDPHYQDISQEYEVLADFGFGNTEEGLPIRAPAHVALEKGPGYIELGVEQTVLVGLYCPAEVTSATCSHPRAGGPKGLARVTSSLWENSLLTGSGFPFKNSSDAR